MTVSAWRKRQRPGRQHARGYVFRHWGRWAVVGEYSKVFASPVLSFATFVVTMSTISAHILSTHVDGLMQGCGNSIANVLALLQPHAELRFYVGKHDWLKWWWIYLITSPHFDYGVLLKWRDLMPHPIQFLKKCAWHFVTKIQVLRDVPTTSLCAINGTAFPRHHSQNRFIAVVEYCLEIVHERKPNIASAVCQNPCVISKQSHTWAWHVRENVLFCGYAKALVQSSCKYELLHYNVEAKLIWYTPTTLDC